MIRTFRYRIDRVRKDNGGFKEFCCMYLDRIFEAFGKKTNFYLNSLSQRFRKVFLRENCYQIKDVRIPVLEPSDEKLFREAILPDTFYSYIRCQDKYDETIYDMTDKFLCEGLYGLVNSRVNVTVQPGDIVIDAGSWIGDFAAYASVRGAEAVYAFEPVDKTFAYLEQTAKLNKNIIPVKKGLSDENTSATLFVNLDGNSGGNALMNKTNENMKETSTIVETVRLDDFVHENNLPRVDFIKSDIEGFERHLLAGAQGVLREFAPKLALCTYHLPDDPQVMADLIMQANPKYNIVQKRMKLFASVPE